MTEKILGVLFLFIKSLIAFSGWLFLLLAADNVIDRARLRRWRRRQPG